MALDCKLHTVVRGIQTWDLLAVTVQPVLAQMMFQYLILDVDQHCRNTCKCVRSRLQLWDNQ